MTITILAPHWLTGESLHNFHFIRHGVAVCGRTRPWGGWRGAWSRETTRKPCARCRKILGKVASSSSSSSITPTP